MKHDSVSILLQTWPHTCTFNIISILLCANLVLFDERYWVMTAQEMVKCIQITCSLLAVDLEEVLSKPKEKIM